jgi:hypothetical protein
MNRDIAAGICILQEAGGLVTRGNPPDNPLTAPIEDVKLGSRLYLGIRYVKTWSSFAKNYANYQLVLRDLRTEKRHETDRKELYAKYGDEFGNWIIHVLESNVFT